MPQTSLSCCKKSKSRCVVFGLVFVTMFLEEAESLIFRSPTFPSYDGVNRPTASNNATGDRTKLINFLGQKQMENTSKVTGLLPLSVTDENEKQQGAKSLGTTAASIRRWMIASLTPANNGRSNNGMRVALFLTYFGVMGAKCALPSTFSLLVAEDSTLIYPQRAAGLTHSQQMSRVLTLSTVCICVKHAIITEYDVFQCPETKIQLSFFLNYGLSYTSRWQLQWVNLF
jgi:hypothetical protein